MFFMCECCHIISHITGIWDKLTLHLHSNNLIMWKISPFTEVVNFQKCRFYWRDTALTRILYIYIYIYIYILQFTSLFIGAIYWQQEYTPKGIDNINAALFMMLIHLAYNLSSTGAVVCFNIHSDIDVPRSLAWQFDECWLHCF